MKRYFIEPVVETWVTREADPDDRWDAGNRDGSVTGVSVHSYETDYTSGSYEEVPKYAVVVGYRTGSTFGTDFSAEVVDCFETEEDATALAQTIDDLYGGWDRKKKRGYSFEHNGVEYSASWEGYFESIQSVDVYPIETKPFSKKY